MSGGRDHVAGSPGRSPDGRAFEGATYTNGGLALAVPPELVEAIAARVAELVADRATGAEPAAEVGDGRRLALTKAEAAEAIGVSVDHLERHVLPELRCVRSGRLRLIPVAELEEWIDGNAARALGDRR